MKDGKKFDQKKLQALKQSNSNQEQVELSREKRSAKEYLTDFSVMCRTVLKIFENQIDIEKLSLIISGNLRFVINVHFHQFPKENPTKL